MSKRKKNAGAGYGYMFHGAFKDKKDAVAKERKTKGAWVKGVFTKQGHRYVVMSPRLNPIKRKKKVKPNPHELLVLGANPSHTIPPASTQDIVVPPGSTITIRMNPTAVANPTDDRYMLAAASQLYPGRQLGQLTAQELSKVAMLAATLKHPRNNVELGTFENGVFHPWTRRPRSRQKKAIRRRNSSAAVIREDFTGMPSEFYSVSSEPHMPAGDYAELGKLLALYVKPAGGGQVQHINFSVHHPVLVADESARHLYFVGGDQDVSSSLATFGARDRGAGVFELGEARRIDYKQRKEHVPDPDTDEWRHEFGEETGVRPVLLFDRPKKRLLLEGGEYEIRREGITN